MAATAVRRNSRIWLLTGLLAVAAAAVCVWGWMETRRLMARAALIEKDNRELRARVQQRQREVAELTAKLRAAGETVRETTVPAAPTGTDTSARVEAIHKLAQLQAQLQGLNTSIAEAEAHNRQLAEQASATEAERTRLATETGELADKLTVSNRTIRVLEGQIKLKDQRLSPLEAENRQLQADEKAARSRLAGLTKLSRDLADIRKRRESLIESLVRHYRELGDLYRTLAMRLDSAGERAGPNPGDQSRIQAALSQADDDLRQLSTLNQRAANLAKAFKF